MARLKHIRAAVNWVMRGSGWAEEGGGEGGLTQQTRGVSMKCSSKGLNTSLSMFSRAMGLLPSYFSGFGGEKQQSLAVRERTRGGG